MYKIRTEPSYSEEGCSCNRKLVLKNIFKEHLNQIRYNVKKHIFIIMITDRLSNTELKR